MKKGEKQTMYANQKAREVLLYLSLVHKGDWEKMYQDIKNHTLQSESEIEKVISQFKGNYITILDSEYPSELKNTYKPPFVLFYEGDLELLNSKEKKLAISSEREVSDNEKEIATSLLKDQADTIFVLGGKGGLDKHFVATHKHNIIVSGIPLDQVESKFKTADNLVISEYPSQAETDNFSFVNRYRIMCGVCDKLFVATKVKKQSGIMTLVNQMLAKGKDSADIMVVPNQIDQDSDQYANNMLISEGASIVYDANGLNWCIGS